MIRKLELALTPEQAAEEQNLTHFISRKLSISKDEIKGYQLINDQLMPEVKILK